MSKKIKKKRKVSDLKKDEVYETLSTTYEVLNKYKWFIIGGFVGVVAVLLIISWVVNYKEKKDLERAEAFYAAFKFAEAPVGESPLALTTGSGVKPFNSKDEKYEKVSESMSEFLSKYGDSKIGSTARLVMAAAKIELKEYDEAEKLLVEYLEENPESPLRPFVYESLGYVHWYQGKIEEADKDFHVMLDQAGEPYLKVKALMHLGDMYNPVVSSQGKQAKDEEKARNYYTQAKEEIDRSVAEEPLLESAKHELEMRLLLLDVR